MNFLSRESADARGNVAKAATTIGFAHSGVSFTSPGPGKSITRFVRASTSLGDPGICRPFGTGIVECRLGNLRVGNTVTILVTAKTVKAGKGKNRVHAHAARASGAGGFGNEIQGSDNIDTTRHTAVKR